MNDVMEFPDTWEEFEEQYGITDSEEVYTNGARLIPSFRVQQWLEHQALEQERKMTVNICGVPHKIIEYEDKFDTDVHFGQIDYKACEIRVNKDMTDECKKEAICHEMVHGIFVHLGYHDYANDEQLVQALGNAIYQGFTIKTEGEET